MKFIRWKSRSRHRMQSAYSIDRISLLKSIACRHVFMCVSFSCASFVRFMLPFDTNTGSSGVSRSGLERGHLSEQRWWLVCCRRRSMRSVQGVFSVSVSLIVCFYCVADRMQTSNFRLFDSKNCIKEELLDIQLMRMNYAPKYSWDHAD